MYRLPEQKSLLTTNWDKTKLVFNFGVSATFRVISKQIVSVPHGNLIEVYQDTLSASTMPYASYAIDSVKNLIFGKDKVLPSFPVNNTLFVDDYCGEECVCSNIGDANLGEL